MPSPIVPASVIVNHYLLSLDPRRAVRADGDTVKECGESCWLSTTAPVVPLYQ